MIKSNSTMDKKNIVLDLHDDIVSNAPKTKVSADLKSIFKDVQLYKTIKFTQLKDVFNKARELFLMIKAILLSKNMGASLELVREEINVCLLVFIQNDKKLGFVPSLEGRDFLFAASVIVKNFCLHAAAIYRKVKYLGDIEFIMLSNIKELSQVYDNVAMITYISNILEIIKFLEAGFTREMELLELAELEAIFGDSPRDYINLIIYFKKSRFDANLTIKLREYYEFILENVFDDEGRIIDIKSNRIMDYFNITGYENTTSRLTRVLFSACIVPIGELIHVYLRDLIYKLILEEAKMRTNNQRMPITVVVPKFDELGYNLTSAIGSGSSEEIQSDVTLTLKDLEVRPVDQLGSKEDTQEMCSGISLSLPASGKVFTEREPQIDPTPKTTIIYTSVGKKTTSEENIIHDEDDFSDAQAMPELVLPSTSTGTKPKAIAKKQVDELTQSLSALIEKKKKAREGKVIITKDDLSSKSIFTMYTKRAQDEIKKYKDDTGSVTLEADDEKRLKLPDLTKERLSKKFTKMTPKQIDEIMISKVANEIGATLEDTGGADTDKKYYEDFEDEWKKDHYGDHSVQNTGCDTIGVELPLDSTSTHIFTPMRDLVEGTNDLVYWVANTQANGWRIESTLQLPLVHGTGRSFTMRNGCHRFVLRGYAPCNFTIKQDECIVIPSAVAVNPELLVGGIIDARRVANAFRSIESPTNENFAKNLSVNMNENRFITKWTSLFTRGHIIVDMLDDFETQNIAPNFGAPLADDITKVVTNLQDYEVPTRNLTQAINDGRFFVSGREMSGGFRKALRLLCLGPGGITTPALHDYVHVGSTIVFEESIKFCIMGQIDNCPDLPVETDTTAATMKAVLEFLAAKYNKQDDYVDARVRASLILSGKVRKNGPANLPRFEWISASLEMGETTMPASRGMNYLWTLLVPGWLPPPPESYLNEYTTLTSSSTTLSNKIGFIIAFMLTIGYSHVFHANNITGLELSAMNSNHPRAAVSQALRSLTEALHGKRYSMIAGAAVRYISQISEYSISVNAILGSRWSGHFLIDNGGNFNLGHGGAFKHKIPYLIQPIVLLRLPIKRDIKWCVPKSGVVGNFKDDIVGVIGQTLSWRATAGESLYTTVAESKKPYKFIVYGSLALQCMSMEARTFLPVNMKFQRIYQTTGKATASEPVLIEDIHINQLASIFVIEAGSILTYDWATQQVIAPAFSCGDVDREIWNVANTSGKRALEYTGLDSETAVSLAGISLSVTDMLDNVRLGDNKGIDKAASIEQQAQSSAEN